MSCCFQTFSYIVLGIGFPKPPHRRVWPSQQLQVVFDTVYGLQLFRTCFSPLTCKELMTLTHTKLSAFCVYWLHSIGGRKSRNTLWNDTGIFFPGRNKFCQTSKLYCVCIGEKSFEVYWTLWPDRCVFCAACRLQDNACASPVLVAGCVGSAKSSSGGIQRSNVMVRYHHHPNAGPESQTFEGQPVCQGVYKKELGELL